MTDVGSSTVTRWPADGVIRFAIAGNLNADNREVLRVGLRNDLVKGERKFVVDLADCPYIDGRAFEMLKAMGEVMLQYGASLRFENANEDLHALFVLTRMINVFPVTLATEAK